MFTIVHVYMMRFMKIQRINGNTSHKTNAASEKSFYFKGFLFYLLWKRTFPTKNRMDEKISVIYNM